MDYFSYVNNFIRYCDCESVLLFGKKERPVRKYTIAIPTYNREHLLKESIDSAINQENVFDYEILIVDNGHANSILDYLRALKRENIYYYKNTRNIEMFGNWNRCIELSKGEFITILNDDDLLSRSYLRMCDKYLDNKIDGLVFKTNKKFEGIYYEKKFRDNNVAIKKMLKMVSRKRNKLTLFDYFLGNKSSGTLGCLFKTKYLKDLGGYNPDFFPSSDYVLHANYCYNFNLYLINEKLNYYRVAENESAKQDTLQKWEYIDNEIRKYFIPLIGKNKKLLLKINSLIQDSRVKGLIDNWNYQTETKVEYKLRHKIFQKLVGLKYYLNI